VHHNIWAHAPKDVLCGAFTDIGLIDLHSNRWVGPRATVNAVHLYARLKQALGELTPKSPAHTRDEDFKVL
jgi:hypothetical protein